MFIVALFILTRMLAALAGVSYDAGVGSLMHMADPALLRGDMMRTLAYLHIQPPLFNLLFGLLMKIFPGHWATVLRGIWMGAGLCGVLALQELMLRLRVRDAMALGAASLLMVCPATILYENWSFYDYPVTAMLCVALLLLRIHLEHGRRVHLAGFLWIVSAIVLTRSLFHLAWMAGIIILLMLLLPGRRRTILTVAILPFLVAALPYMKNLLLFDEFSCSTWFGPSLAKMTLSQLDSGERQREVARGELSPVSLVPPYSPVEAYPASAIVGAKPTGIPVLDEQRKMDGGATNFNSLVCLAISRAYRRDATGVLTHHPLLYAGAVARSSFYYCYPASVNFMMGENRSAIAGYERIFDLVIYGQLFDYQSVGEKEGHDAHGIPKLFKIGLFIVAEIAIVLPFGIAYARRMLRPGGNRADGVTLVVIVATIVWVMLVGNLLEIGENYRFRFMIDPFHHLLLALFLSRWPARRRFVGAIALLRRGPRQDGGE